METADLFAGTIAFQPESDGHIFFKWNIGRRFASRFVQGLGLGRSIMFTFPGPANAQSWILAARARFIQRFNKRIVATVVFARR